MRWAAETWWEGFQTMGSQLYLLPLNLVFIYWVDFPALYCFTTLKNRKRESLADDNIRLFAVAHSRKKCLGQTFSIYWNQAETGSLLSGWTNLDSTPLLLGGTGVYWPPQSHYCSWSWDWEYYQGADWGRTHSGQLLLEFSSYFRFNVLETALCR